MLSFITVSYADMDNLPEIISIDSEDDAEPEQAWSLDKFKSSLFTSLTHTTESLCKASKNPSITSHLDLLSQVAHTADRIRSETIFSRSRLTQLTNQIQKLHESITNDLWSRRSFLRRPGLMPMPLGVDSWDSSDRYLYGALEELSQLKSMTEQYRSGLSSHHSIRWCKNPDDEDIEMKATCEE